MKFISHSLLETEDFAKKYIGDFLRLKEGAFVIGLYGNLGSGKTAFTQAFARLLGISDGVTSPTYVIEKIYPLSNSLSSANSQVSPMVFPHVMGAFTHLIHIDAYRLESYEEMKHLGWAEIVANPKNIIVVEWPERIAPLLPTDHARLKFTFIDETTREIEIQ